MTYFVHNYINDVCAVHERDSVKLWLYNFCVRVRCKTPKKTLGPFLASMESHEGGVGLGWSQWSESTTFVHLIPMVLVNKPHRRTAQLPPSYVHSVASLVSSIILSLLLLNLVPKTNLTKIKMSFSQSSASWKNAAKLNTFDQILVALSILHLTVHFFRQMHSSLWSKTLETVGQNQLF